jgi:hypothetical protein
MLEALVLAAGLGVLLGLRYRAPAVVVGSGVAALMGPAVAYVAGASFWVVVIAPVGAVVALQCGYLGGSLLTFMMPRPKPERRLDAPHGCFVAKD